MTTCLVSRRRTLHKAVAALYVATVSATNAAATDPTKLAQESATDLSTAQRCVDQSTRKHIEWAQRLSCDIDRTISEHAALADAETADTIKQARTVYRQIAKPPPDPEGPLPDEIAPQRAYHLLAAANAQAAAKACRIKAQQTKAPLLREELGNAAEQMLDAKKRHIEHATSMTPPDQLPPGKARQHLQVPFEIAWQGIIAANLVPFEGVANERQPDYEKPDVAKMG